MVRISKSFIKSSLIYTIAGAMPMASAIILLPFYLHFLSTETFGALSIYFVFSLLTQILVMYGFDSSVYIHFHEYKNDASKLSSFISSAFMFMLMLSIGAGAILFVGGSIFFKLADINISFYPYGVASIGSGIFQALLKVHSNLAQSRQMATLYFWSNVLCFALIVVFTIVGLELFPDTLLGPVVGRFLASFIVGSWVLVRIFREFGLYFNFQLLRSSFSFNNYLFIYQILQWIINYFDRVIMTLFLSLESVGIYDFTVKCLLIIEFFVGGVHNSILPRVIGIVAPMPVKRTTVEVNRYYHGLTALIILFVCLSILFFPIVIDFFGEDEYQETVKYLPYAALIYLLRSLRFYFLFPYNVIKYSKPLPFIYFVVAIVKIALMMVLIPKLEIYGVIISSLVAGLMEVILIRVGIKGKFDYKINILKMIYVPALLFFLIGLLEFFLQDIVNRDLLHIAYLLLGILVLWWAYRMEIKHLSLKQMFKK